MNVKSPLIRLFLLGFLILLINSLCFAQTALITGRVTDSTGGVVPGTSITIIQVSTGVERSVVTNDVGSYTVPLLQPGEYRIEVELTGFKPINRSGIILEVDQRAEINFELEIGDVTETIDVVSDTVQLNSIDGSQGQVIENQRIVDMPLNGRDYNQLALLTAGAVQPVGGRYGGFSVGGQRTTQNNFVLDGLDNNGAELAGAQRRSEMVKPSIDAIQEFKVQTNSYAAEYGRAMGGVVNVTTKSGTNQFHGTVFGFLRNEVFDARNYFTPKDADKPPYKRSQFGFSAGGPVIKDRIFLFGDWEGTRIRESATRTSTIPTLKMRTGDFSELSEAIIDPMTGEPFPGNIIPSNRLDPVAQTLINLYPQPQNSDLKSNFVWSPPRTQDVNKWDIRGDWVVTDKDNFSYRFSKHDFQRPVTLNLPPPAYGGGNDQEVSGINTGMTWNRVWSPTIVTSFRSGWNYGLFIRDNPAQTNGELLNEKYGITGGSMTNPGGFSIQGISGYRNVGIGAFNPVDRNSQNWQAVGDLSWAYNNHNLKFGANIIRSQNNIFNISHNIGSWSYNGRYTGDGMADFSLGMASQWRWHNGINVQLRQQLWGFYAQDDWKVSPKLTLNFGLRYELLLPWVDKHDRMGIYDITTDPQNPELIYAGDRGTDRFNRAMYALDKNNFMPRLGFAYKITDNTVLRGGYGVFYAYMEPYGDAQYLIGNPPATFGVTRGSSADTPAAILSEGPPEGSTDLEKATGITFTAYDRYPSLSSAQQWNINVQHEFARDWLFEIGYSGSRGTNLLRRYDGNFSPPGPGGIDEKRPYQRAEVPGTDIVLESLGQLIYYTQDGESNYQALVSRLEKRFSDGLTALVSYSFSKSLGDTCGNAAAGNAGGCGFQDLRKLYLEKSVDNQHVPHRLSVSSIYELPFGQGRKYGSDMNSIADAVVGGWAIGSIITFTSGRPYNATVGGNPANSGTHGVHNRPDVSGDPYAGFTRTVEEDFNTSVFTPNQQYQIGNFSRNGLRQRDQFNWDFSALKDFVVTEDVRVQFRFEAFHFTNTPRFSNANGNVTSGGFGEITGAGTPRNLQFGLKIIW